MPSKPSLAWRYACHLLPILRWLPRYAWRSDLAGDLVAALTVTAVAAPEAVSYASIAGLPAAQGLYTGLLGPLAYALTGSSPQLIVGPTAIMCILTYNAIPTSWGGVPVPDLPSGPNVERVALAGLLALAVAALQGVIAVLRLGSLVGLISLPVVAGFTTGSALLTASSQFATLLGLSRCKPPGAGGSGCTFGQALVDIVNHWSSIQWAVVGMSLACIALLLCVKALPRALPPRFALLGNLAPLVLVLVSVPISWVYEKELDAHGLPAPQPIPSGLPPILLPFGAGSPVAHGTSSDVTALFGAALPLAIVGYMGAVTIAKTVARQYGPYHVDSAQEAWGQVAANFACAVGSGLPVTGSFSRTAVNASSGARSGLASVLTGLFMGLSLLTLTTPLAHIPTVARSAIVIVAITKMVELHLFVRFWRVDRPDALVFAVTLAVVLFLDSATGLLAGVGAQWAVALIRGQVATSPVVALAWSRTRGAAASAQPSGDAAAAARAVAAGWTWGEATPAAVAAAAAAAAAAAVDGSDVGEGRSQRLLLRKGSSVNDGDELPPAPAPGTLSAPVAVVSFGPDLQFANADRLGARLNEAIALLSPALLVVDLSAATSPASNAGGSVGLTLDASGAAALLGAADDAALAGVPLAAYGLRPGHVTHLLVAAAEGGGSGAATAAAGALPANRLARAAAARAGGALAGNLLLLPSWAATEAVAQEVCAAAALGELEAHPHAATFFEDAGEEDAPGKDGAAPASAKPARRRVHGVEPSPLDVAATAARRAKGLPPHVDTAPADLLSVAFPGATAADFSAAAASAAAKAARKSAGGGAAAAVVSALVAEAAASIAIVRTALGGEAPLLSAPPHRDLGFMMA